MARLANQANLGFVPLPADALPLIASFLPPAPAGMRVLDPCAGEGVAIATLAETWGVPQSGRYLNELNDARAAQCRERAMHVTACDTLKWLRAKQEFASLAYVNPPFDNDGAEEGGGRLEPKFFRRVVEEGRWVQTGGIVIIVTPQDILSRQESINHLARCYEAIEIYQLPEAIRHYREAVVFGVVRRAFLVGEALRHEAARLKVLLDDELPMLTYQEQPRYDWPKPATKKPCWRDYSEENTANAQSDVIATGGAWRSKKVAAAAAAMDKTILAPTFPLSKPLAALRIADGAINGQEVVLDGIPQRVKGTTQEMPVTTVEEKADENGFTVTTRVIKRRVPLVTTIDAEGTLRMFKGDKGMAELMSHEGTAEALLAAVEQSAPPRYQLDMEPAVKAVLDAIRPRSGRALPGYAPGMLPMQKHVAAAIVRAVLTPDPSQDNTTPDSALVGAEMGCGKVRRTTASVIVRHVPQGEAHDLRGRPIDRKGKPERDNSRSGTRRTPKTCRASRRKTCMHGQSWIA